LKQKRCAYCGNTDPDMTMDHVIPDCLYPKSKRTPELQLITVPACSECNSGFSADETHFRAVMTISGEINKPVQELWDTKMTS
jgi:5-methylcytosine-specific restriction endonuclease McrA